MKLFLLILLIFAFIPNVFGLACPKGFSLINSNKCLKLFTTKLKHLEAEEECSYLGGTLATVKTAIDNRAITNLAASASASTIWLGMFCFTNGTTIPCYHDDNSGPLIYNNFASGNPKIQGAGGCVYMTTTGKTAGQWTSSMCENVGMPYICEVPTTVADSTCTRNYNGYCYLPSHELNLATNLSTYGNAQSICKANGANLASIHSKREIDYIRAMYKNTKITDLYIGAQSPKAKTWKWEDGTAWNFDYRDPLSNTLGTCLLMDLYPNLINNGLWGATNCGNVFNFLCMRKIAAKVEEPKEIRIGEDHWHSFKDLPPSRFDSLVPKHPKDISAELLNTSNCNTTLFLAPGTITSYGYPSTKPPKTFCTWTIVTLGPYRAGIYFTDFSVANAVNVYDEYGGQINGATGSQSPFYNLAPTNYVKITHDSTKDAAGGYHGFSATILPY